MRYSEKQRKAAEIAAYELIETVEEILTIAAWDSYSNEGQGSVALWDAEYRCSTPEDLAAEYVRRITEQEN